MKLFLLVVLTASVQSRTQKAPGFCQSEELVETLGQCTSCAVRYSCPSRQSVIRTENCTYEVSIGGRQLLLSGCRTICGRRVFTPKCCPQFWGSLCLACPSWSGKTCNYRGICSDGETGNGTCACEDKFTGFACNECKNPNAYGADCDKVCDCDHGICNKGPEGDGQCFCQPPYSGTRCDQLSSGCRSCPPYSYCRGDGDSAVCDCLPGHRKTNQGKCATVCSSRDCDVNAQCSSQGSKISCACNADYEGDGRICVPKNPCLQNNGGCPADSTVCVFTGPNKSKCQCMVGMRQIIGRQDCELVSACLKDTCDYTATCHTELDGQPRCECSSGQIGDGHRCFGSLMEQLGELRWQGSPPGDLTATINMFEKGCGLLLRHNGPFTAFIPTTLTPLNGVSEEEVCKNHLILGQHLYKDLEGKDLTLYGGGRLRSKGNKKLILLDDPTVIYTVLSENHPAANGVIHIIDRVMIGSKRRPSRNDKFADFTIYEILRKDDQFNRFLSLVDNCGAPLHLNGPGPLTVFVPNNQAIDAARDGSILYMINTAKHKLQELLRHHMMSQASLTSDDLAILPQIHTTANQVVRVSVADDGQLVLGDKGVHVVSSNYMASNGIIHVIDGLLIPPSIIPIMPQRCDVVENKITQGPCTQCSYLFVTNCPVGSVELDTHMTGCEYQRVSDLKPSLVRGCAKNCNTTKTVAECCKGFYGPDCKPCIGGFENPCFGKGTCSDGMKGDGSCSCRPGFEGVACHICSDRRKHGENCDEECKCVHGVCDNRPGSGGRCRVGSCLEGFSGDFCDKQATPCNADRLTEHCHIHAFCSYSDVNTVCVCRDGYEGDGHSCSPINPCLKNNRGDCDANAECVYNGPGNASCVCGEGWSGDGKVCVEINLCQSESRGDCSANATCTHIGPGQAECVCKKGYSGNGKVCDLINPCSENNGGCHELATCKQGEEGTHTCTCPDGYHGNGSTCYGTIIEDLEMMQWRDSNLYRFIRRIPSLPEDLHGNITVLAPSVEAFRNFSSDYSFWINRHHVEYFTRAHVLPGVYSVEDLEKLVGTKVATLNPQTNWEVSQSSTGMIRIGNATITDPNRPAINGFIHIVDQVMPPARTEIPPDPLKLMEFLNKTSNFSLFRDYALLYNLSGESMYTFTLLLPTDQAIREHLQKTNSTELDSDTFKYHIIPSYLLRPNQLYDGLVHATLLGAENQLQFHINDKNQTSVNDVPLNESFIQTESGIIYVLERVLSVQKNRCGRPLLMIVSGRCTDCDGPPRCSFQTKPVRSEFPPNMKSNCRHRKRVGSRSKSVPGCVIKCLQETTDHSCCPGFYGHDCYRCPGELGSPCSNHGQCQDGHEGSGECRCFEGFHGTACEECEPGRYGTNCSKQCRCDHGKCADGLTGSGLCECYKGWKGSSCSIEIRDDACGGNCDNNANCITGPQGSAPACVCVAGYEGNGTHCSELDLCRISNGGCSPYAVCTKVSAGERTCSCSQGYTGDGVVCIEMDGCLVNNGGCDKSAECIRNGPNRTACRCLPGFRGSGRYCIAVNPCREDNGGCSRFAYCSYLGQGQRNCSCRSGYVGDGMDCRGSVSTEISRQAENGFFRQMFTLSGTRNLYGEGPYTIFVPLEESNNHTTVTRWMDQGRLGDMVRYHIVSCENLNLNDLKSTDKAVAQSGHTLRFSYKQGTLWINDKSRIVRSDYTAFNGVIHHIDTLLTPYTLQDKRMIRANEMNITEASAFYGYTKFYKLIESSGLLPVLDLSIHKPFTMFWPSDQAMTSLPAERQRWLTSPDHQEELAAIIKAHTIRNSKVMGISSPDKYQSSYRSMHGSVINYSCDKKLVGNIWLNDNAAQVTERYLMFSEGIAYGIDQLLEPPGLGAHCDGIENKTSYGRCGRCLIPPSCRFRHVDTGKVESCSLSSRRYSSRYTLDFDLSTFGRRGCKRVCQFPSWTQQCCKNHYGRDCTACPGGVESPCGLHGTCDDGMKGLGQCLCQSNFRGDSCELCIPNHYGPNCTACACTARGSCEDGMEGSGACVCESGWIGDRCQTELSSIPEECRDCHKDAQCEPGSGCSCKPGFQGNGTYCEPLPPPDLCAEYNGGCHSQADCNQTGLLVNCTCHSGYQGDGFTCQPINRCTAEVNGGCSDFASCTFTGPNDRECACLPGYVGNGVQCLEKVEPPVDRCLENNGDCDPVAECKDLHYHTNTGGVFHLRSPLGKYKMNFTQAKTACENEGGVLATFKQLGDAQQLGMHLCTAGWFEGAKVGYPIRFPSARCGDNHVGVVLYRDPVDQSSQYDAYCYRLRDVSCSCPSDFVGNGDFCNGVLADVLGTYSNFSIFYRFMLDYSSTKDGKKLMEFLSQRNTEVTLFVPHNDGFTFNKTLSGRDLEYHISTNHSRRSFKEMKHKEIIVSRLGFNLTVTHGKNESIKLVNRRLLLDWDIPAVNGLIHVIEGPLTAPPPPISHSSHRMLHSSSSTAAILASLFVACLVAAVGYYVFKHKTDAFRFHYFKNEDEDGGTRTRPALVSIPNPLYVGSCDLSQTCPGSSQEPEPPAEPQEPPQILDLDQ